MTLHICSTIHSRKPSNAGKNGGWLCLWLCLVVFFYQCFNVGVNLCNGACIEYNHRPTEPNHFISITIVGNFYTSSESNPMALLFRYYLNKLTGTNHRNYDRKERYANLHSIQFFTLSLCK